MRRKVNSYILILIFSLVFCINTVDAKKISEVSIGDRIKMTPTSTNYTISKDITGYDKDQTINPSELNLWRVIKVNDDGTVDAVSEYVSTNQIYFQGIVGYMNIVSSLNKIASEYTNSKYVSKIRHMGYSNQTEICTDFSSSKCPLDTGHLIDVDLVKKTLNTLIGKDFQGNPLSYFLASRNIQSNNTSIEYKVRIITSSGTTSENTLFFSNDTEDVFSAGIRPIITFKEDTQLGIPNSEGIYELNDENKNPIDSSNPKDPVEDNSNLGEGQDNIKDDQINNDSQQNPPKNEVENPNTGGFVACVFIFITIGVLTFILNFANRKTIFKL